MLGCSWSILFIIIELIHTHVHIYIYYILVCSWSISFTNYEANAHIYIYIYIYIYGQPISRDHLFHMIHHFRSFRESLRDIDAFKRQSMLCYAMLCYAMLSYAMFRYTMGASWPASQLVGWLG